MNQYNEEFDGYLDDDPFENNNNNDNNTNNNNNNGNNNNNNGYAQSHIQLLDTSPSNMKRLIDAGYKTVDDFQNQTAVTLAKECNLTNKDALHIIRQVKMGVQSLRNQFFIKQQQQKQQQQQQFNISTTHNNNNNNPTTTSSTTPTISTPTTNNNNNNTTSTTTSTVRTKSAFESLQQHRDRKSIITFCKEVDDLLHGGIPMGRTSEICGVPGVGKTQLALQLAVNVQLPSAMDGCEGECLYIDTEGSFMTERLEQIAIAFVKHIHRMKNALVASLSSLSSTSSGGGGGDGETGEEDEELKKQREMIEKRIAAIEAMTVDGVMQRVRYYRLFNLLEQLAFVQILDSYVKQNNIKLIIFDSITFHFRHDQAGFGDTFQRSRLLQAMGQKMSQIANDNDIAVVYLNQVTTKIDKNDSSHSHLAPALGMTWSNACNNHFFLEFDRGERYFRINKSLHSEPSRAKFAITADGFRGVNRRTIAYEEIQSTAADQSNEQSRKRQRE